MECKTTATGNPLHNAKRQNSLRFRLTNRLSACDTRSTSPGGSSGRSRSSVENSNKEDSVVCNHSKRNRTHHNKNNFSYSKLRETEALNVGSHYEGNNSSDDPNIDVSGNSGSDCSECRYRAPRQKSDKKTFVDRPIVSGPNSEIRESASQEKDCRSTLTYDGLIIPDVEIGLPDLFRGCRKSKYEFTESGRSDPLLGESELRNKPETSETSDIIAIPEVVIGTMNRSAFTGEEHDLERTRTGIHWINWKRDINAGLVWLQEQVVSKSSETVKLQI